MSAAGGAHKAVERAAAVKADCCQLFLTPPQQWPKGAGALTATRGRWQAGVLADETRDLFRDAKSKFGMEHVIAHSSYLINLASPDKILWHKSLEAFALELLRADQLGIPYVVLHPGAATSGSEQAGLRRVARALNEIHRRTRGITAQCLLENTAGQGSCLGWRFEHLGAILQTVKEPERVGVCLDTCHAFAAGYPLASPADYAAMIDALDRLVGLDRLKAIHLNDSKRELNSRVDRHEHIGRGQVGNQAFKLLLHDPRLRSVPMYLETPKGDDPKTGKPWDVINLRRLRRLAVARLQANG
jgi:deoxyribonuclease-4